jgi:hypothetical protein
METTKRVIVLTEQGHVIPLNVKWSNHFSVPTNIARYVKPLIGGNFITAITRAYVWVGHNDWSYKYDALPVWRAATSAQETDNTLWII